jgi:hypothetical protein
MFSVAGERLTLRMRRIAFEAMLRQEMAWFDRAENQGRRRKLGNDDDSTGFTKSPYTLF